MPATKADELIAGGKWSRQEEVVLSGAARSLDDLVPNAGRGAAIGFEILFGDAYDRILSRDAQHVPAGDQGANATP